MPTDATTSPVPAWKRYATIGVLTILVVVAPYVIYVKEIKHSSSDSAGSSAPAASTVPPSAPATTVAPSTTIPGGLPISSRNPLVPNG